MNNLLALGLPHGSEWIWIAGLVVLLFGAKKLPELARGLGRSLGEFKRAKQEFEAEIQKSAKEEPIPSVVPTPGAIAQGCLQTPVIPLAAPPTHPKEVQSS